MVGALHRLGGIRLPSYEQLLALVRSQQATLDQYSPYGQPRPSIGALPKERLGNLRTPMQDRPTQQTHDFTRTAATNVLASQPPGGGPGGAPDGGIPEGLPASALRKLTAALERNSNSVPLPKFNGKQTS